MSTRAADWLARGIQPEWTLTVVASKTTPATAGPSRTWTTGAW
jgi:hypothetical protein